MGTGGVKSSEGRMSGDHICDQRSGTGTGEGQCAENTAGQPSTAGDPGCCRGAICIRSYGRDPMASKQSSRLPGSAARQRRREWLLPTADVHSVAGSGSFGRVVRKFSAPQITLVAYPFAARWLYWFGQKQHNSQVVPSLTCPEKSRLLRLSGVAVWPADPEPSIMARMTPPYWHDNMPPSKQGVFNLLKNDPLTEDWGAALARSQANRYTRTRAGGLQSALRLCRHFHGC
jgi:hypothetical protein